MPRQTVDESATNSAIEPSDNGDRYDSFRAQDANASSSPPEASIRKPNASTRLLAPDLQRGLLMALMAMDHVSLGLHTWQHGTNREGEKDGVIVRQWNFTTAYIVRTLTHLCAPGFTFLLGMGVVYLSRSRTKLGWSAWHLLRYYTTRVFVLTAVTSLMGLAASGGTLWFLNMILFALAVDYLLVGMLWLLMERTERMLARALAKVLLAADKHRIVTNHDDEDDEDEAMTRPLLYGSRHTTRESAKALLASSLSWHIHNTILLVLSIVTIWWNIWLSENNGHCNKEESITYAHQGLSATTVPQNAFLRIWFWSVRTEHIISDFPPMTWLSFAILGLLYGRILSAKKWTSSTLAVGHISAGLIFAIIFVLTRVLQLGNLSEDCLRTPDQDRNPQGNPYLASPASFFYIIKYSPDVAFWAFTMAANLFLLGIFSAIPTRIAKRFTMLVDFGTSSLFFYVVHLYIVISPLTNCFKDKFGSDTGIPDVMNPGSTKGVTNLFWYFTLWFCLLLFLWPACRYYSRFKSTKHADSLWRFF